MKKLLVLATAFMISTAAVAGLTDVYNAIDTNNTSTKVDQKAAALKNKIDSKLNKLSDKATTAETKSTEKQEALKESLEKKLSDLQSKGQGNSEQATEIKSEIAALQRLIDAARK